MSDGKASYLHEKPRALERWRRKKEGPINIFPFPSSSHSKEWPPFKSSRFSRTQSRCDAWLLSQYVFRTPDSPFTSLIAPGPLSYTLFFNIHQNFLNSYSICSLGIVSPLPTLASLANLSSLIIYMTITH